MDRNLLKCALCEKNKEMSELTPNPCTNHCTCSSCYEFLLTTKKKSNVDCSNCQIFYKWGRSKMNSLLRTLVLANNECNYCKSSECDDKVCKKHKPCRKCQKKLLQFMLEECIDQCIYCWRIALFCCNLCMSFTKINEKFRSVTCKYHFFCRQCCQNRNAEIYQICTACGNECQKFITSYMNNSYNEIPQSLENYQNYNMPQRFVQNTSALYLEPISQIYHQNYNMPQRFVQISETLYPETINKNNMPQRSVQSSETLYPETINKNNMPQRSVQSSETLYPETINKNYHQNLNNAIISNTKMGNNYLGNTISQPNLETSRNILQPNFLNPSHLNQIKNKFEKDFLELIQKLNENDIIFLNSKNYGLYYLDETCPVKFCFSFDLVQDIALNIVRNYGINEKFVFHYKHLFEGIKMKFANCQKCRFCTGFFEFNDYCLWCALGVAN